MSMSSKTKVRLFSFLAILLTSLLLPRIAELASEHNVGLQFAISFPEASSKEQLDGRLLLLVSTDSSREPRFQISEDLTTQQVFGIDVEGLRPGQEAIVGATAFGYPVRNLAQVPRGEYTVQALLHRYETFKRSDGHTVKLPTRSGLFSDHKDHEAVLHDRGTRAGRSLTGCRRVRILSGGQIDPVRMTI